MTEYKNLDQMSEVSLSHIENVHPIYYLPHHAVTKESSTTTKIRVVFDGSCRTSTGLSINDVQYVGPIIQDELFYHLLRFRQYRYVLSADITKMYRQILIHPDQRKLQLILWRENSEEEVKTFQLHTVTYGMADAPHLATRCLKQIAEDCRQENSRASQVIEHNFYMDDLLTGGEDLEETRKLKIDLSRILKAYGFELRKSASNEAQILEDQSEAHEQKHFQDLKDPKTLGLLWDPESDTLRFFIQIHVPDKITKRTILSTIARIYDPLGLIGPVTICAKLLLQKMWQEKITWDEDVPSYICNTWRQYQTQLKGLEDIVIPRLVRSEEIDSIQIHGFSDASEKAFGACIYVRTTDKQGNHAVHLLAAKSRVAPLHSVTLPRLELNGAVLLARLSAKIEKALNIDRNKFYWWSDSEIVLHWIAGSPGRWNTFVGNRVAEIQELTTDNWHHVSTKHNPADIISRGISSQELGPSRLWWNGPKWLAEDETQWPVLPTRTPEIIPEIRQEKSRTMMILTEPESDLSDILTRYSLFSKLVRVISYCYRFFRNTRINRTQRSVGALSVDELNCGTRAVIRIAQQQDFMCEIKQLQENKQISKRSRIIKLQPFIDKDNLLRHCYTLN